MQNSTQAETQTPATEQPAQSQQPEQPQQPARPQQPEQPQQPQTPQPQSQPQSQPQLQTQPKPQAEPQPQAQPQEQTQTPAAPQSDQPQQQPQQLQQPQTPQPQPQTEAQPQEQAQTPAAQQPQQPQQQSATSSLANRLSICRSCLNLLADNSARDDKRLEAAEQISDELQFIADTSIQANRQLLEQTITTFLTFLETTEPQFISEKPCQKLRKLILEMIHRLPALDALREHVDRIIKIMFRLFEIENEENVGIVLRIIIEVHKSYKPEFIPEIYSFLDNVKSLYSDITKVYDLNTMFDDKRHVVKELTDQKVEEILATIHTVTTVEVESTSSPQQQAAGTSSQACNNNSSQHSGPASVGTPTLTEPSTPGAITAPASVGDTCSSSSSSQQSSTVQLSKQTQTFTLLPKASQSIRVIAELPIIVVLLYQMYKTQLQQPLEQLLPLVLETTVLRPPENIRYALRTSDKLDKEIYVEFISAQIKCLSFVAYLVRMYIGTVTKHHTQLTQGLLALLNDCPHEVVSVRKELIAASKYIFQSDLRDKFIEHLHTLCNDDILVGTGWTVYETLRPQAYHILVDLLVNYKGRIKLNDLASAINLFAKNLHDNTLPPHVQLLSCKAFNNLIAFTVAPVNDENIDQREINSIRELLMRIIEVFVLKFKNIAVFHLPHIRRRIKAQQQQHMQQSTMEGGVPSTASQVSQLIQSHQTQLHSHIPSIMRDSQQNMSNPEANRDDRMRVDFVSSSTIQNYSMLECKTAIKSLIIGVKTAIENIPTYRSVATSPAEQLLTPPGAKLFHPKETIILVRLLKYGLKALDIFTLAPSNIPMNGPVPQMSRQMMAQVSRGKEEKELMESFASVFTNLHPLIFHEVFSKMIDFVIERTRQNVSLLAIVNFIVSASSVSPIFSTILSEYLIERMEEIGSNDALSDLYLRLFKMVFASVTLYPAENEQMLKPLLHSIVNKSVELALSAKEPYNYFLLLRALFRSIGGGSHDQLYTEFLPLLPNLLQGLNSFQSGQHKQQMKDLFTELCLTVPVRLSSLMPFMPTLIYPLVSALNGPNQLVIQGMRTLELCVDNLSPDYLYDLLQPVRAELMQGLWKTVRHQNDSIAQTCLRVLGKFGGNNRRMLIEPQKLTYTEQKEGSSSNGTTIVVHFPDQKVSINLPIDRAIYIACETLKQPNTNAFYKLHSWELIKGLLVASIGNGIDHNQKIKNFFSNPNLATAHIPIRRENIYKCPDQVSRKVYQTALIGAMMAASTPNLRNSAVPFLNAIVRHHIMLSIGQHLSPKTESEQPQGMDPFCLVDALAVVIGHDDKELCKSGYYVIVLMIETASMLLGSKERACELPLINYLVKSMYELCYTRAWFSKMGGCISIRFFTDNMPVGWLFRYLSRFVRALLYIMSDLTGELSSGCVDTAQTNLERLINVCGKPIVATREDTALSQAQIKASADVTELLIKEITSQNLSVRTHAMKSIELLAKLANKSAAEIMEPHQDVLRTMLPFLATQQEGMDKQQPIHALEKQPVRTQIGIIHGSTFCTNLEPKVFTIDTSIDEHKYYVDQLVRICESNDVALKKFQCYANVTNLAPVRTAALNALASLHYLNDYKNIIFKILFKSTESISPDLQEEAYVCIVKFSSKVTIDLPVIQEEVSPLLTKLKDSSVWNMASVKRLLCIAKLFPAIFNESFCLELQEHLNNISKSAYDKLKLPLNANEKVYERTSLASEKMKVCAGIIDLLTLVPTVVPNTISKLMSIVLKIETQTIMETGSPLREPLKRFLRRFPEQTVSLLLTERNLNEQQVYRLMKFIIKGEDGDVFRNVISQPSYYQKLMVLTTGIVYGVQTTEPDESGRRQNIALDLRYQAILIISIMIKYDNEWLISRGRLVENLQKIWTSEEFHRKHNKVETTDYTHWKEPKLLIQCLLNYFKNQTAAGNKEVIELLFQLLRVFMNRYLCDFEFFKVFLDKTVIETYSIEWKRDAFAKFVNVFHDPNYPQKLKAKILQYIIIPSFSHSFEKGLGEALLGGPPQPEKENPNNLIHMFINKVIDPICSDKKFIISDAVRILLLQFSCLLVDQASPHIHEATNRRQGSRLKKLVTLAWPCLVNKTSVDPAAKYHGHFLLSHIIAKFAVHRRIIIQVFQSLLKASTPDARVVVKQALDILLPAIPARLEEGNSLLLKCTKKIIIEEGHTMNQLIHMLQLLVRHYRLYYPIRQQLIPLMINSIHRLGYTFSGPLENRKTAVDLCEVIMRWEMFRQKDLRDKKKPTPEDPFEPLDPKHVDSILNALLRLYCIINPSHCEFGPTQAFNNCKNLSDRCMTLIRKIFTPESSWGGSPIVSPEGPNLTFSNWMSELLCSVQNPNCNVGGISGALELLTYMCPIMKREAMLANLKILTNGIIACTTSPNSRIIRSVSSLVQRVMNVFPTQPTSSSANSPVAPHEELETLYNKIHHVIMSGLNLYEQTQNNHQPTNARERDTWQVRLFSSLMLLKAACINNPTYIDRTMPTLIRVIQKMTREHITHVETSPMSIELLILGLDLVKNRLGTMSQDLRKQFIQQILSNLIENPSSDVKVLKAVVRIVEEWMKQKQVPPMQGPNLREKTLLLIKLMLFIEKRFPTEPELNQQFLELIYFVYRDDELKTTDLTTKLESAFMAGLRCVQPNIRAKFFQIYDQSVKPKLYERLMYIVCAQNWQQIGCHFWIQQCIEFILAIAMPELPISTLDTGGCLPCVPTTADLGSYNPNEYETSSSLLSMLSNDANTVVPPPEDVEFVPTHDKLDNLLGFMQTPKTLEEMTARKNLQIMVNRQVNFLEDLKKTRTGDLLCSLTQLCHMSVDLAKTTWINMFPRIWKVLNDQQMTLLGREIIPFLCSGAHGYQRDCNPSAVGAFMEAVSKCHPPIQMRPILIKYLGKNHNIWHRAALMLEECCKDKSLDTVYPIPARSNKAHQQNQQDFDIVSLNPKVTLAEEAVESISDILELLREDDMWCGLWNRKSQYDETKFAVLCEQQGKFAQAQEYYEAALNRQRREFNNTCILKPGMKSENRLWEKHWIRCTKELNQWDSLLEFGSSKACTNPMLVLESAWRVPNWPMMKEALVLVEPNCPASLMWRLNLYKGYNFICNHDDVNELHMVDESFHLATSYCIQTWKKLPHIITNAHIPLLQAAQQLLELNEAKSLHLSLYGVNRSGIHELRTIMKAWPKRVPILLDDISYWSDILTWRQHQYQTIVTHFENQAVNQASQVAMGHAGPVCISEGPASVAMQGAHFSAQGIISFGTIARKQGSLNVCLDAINRIHTMPSVPIFDCYQKIRQQVKCYLQMPLSPDKSELLDGIDIIECTNLKFFQKEYVAEFYTYKGIFLSRLGRHEDANKAFSAAAQLHDQIPKVWSAWGQYLETRFTQDFTQSYEGFTINSNNYSNRQMDLGVSAVTCYLQTCRFHPEPKARKYIAKILWLLSFDNQKGDLVELLNKYSGSNREYMIPPQNWIVWIPQLLQCLMNNPEADALRNLLVTVGKHAPQAVYFPLRTLLLTLKIVFGQRMRTAMPNVPMSVQSSPMPRMSQLQPPTPTSTSIATPSQPTTTSTPVSTSSSGPVPMDVSSNPPPSITTPNPPSTNLSQPIQSPSMAPSPAAAPSPALSTSGLQHIKQPLTPIPAISPQSGFIQSPSPYHQQSASPSTSSTAASQQPTLIQQLQQPPTLLGSTSKTMPSPGNLPAMHPQSPQSKAMKTRARVVTRCSEIVKRLAEAHPTTISSLEGITDQMIWLRDYSYEEVQRQIHQALTKCYMAAFENVNNIANQPVNPQTLNFVKKLVTTFGVGLSSNMQGSNNARCGYYNTTLDYLALRNQAIIQDPEFQQTRVKFSADFEDSSLSNMKLISLIAKLKNWINILGQKKKLMPKTYLMEDKCRFLSNFSQHTADVEIPGDALMPKSTFYYVRIARFIPEVKVVEKHNTSARRILIRGHNGKIYPYLVLNDSCLSDSRREERVLQMLRLLNQYLVNKKETCRRFLQFTVPRVVAINPGLRLVEDNPSSLSLIDILKRRINHNRPASCDMDQDTPINEYYERQIQLQTQNQATTHKNLKDILLDIQNKMVPRNLLKDWANQTYINATDFWVFRTQFTYQLAMVCLCEYAFHLTRLMPENMYIHQDTGQLNVSFFKFDLDDTNGDLKANRPVPFRLTPNLAELITPTGIVGPFRGALDAVSNCLTNPQSRVISIFRAILRDEMLFWQKRGQDVVESEVLVTIVNRAVSKIYQRLNSIASNDRPLESQSPQLINQATSYDQLCQMDPAWHPWL